MIRLSAPILDASVESAVTEVLRSGQLASGAQVSSFQDEFTRRVTPGAASLAVNSGTAALHIPLLAAGIGAGDEVIVPAFTFAGTANAVAATGATPVFADVDPATALIDLAHAESLITPRTAAVIPVHLYGNPVDMESCGRFARKHSLFLLEDAAQAHLASFEGKPVGTLGDAAAFSFYATKNMTTGEGGMITTRDSTLAEKCQILLNQGQSERYRHVVPGWNFRMTNLAAAIGLVQLTHLGEWTATRRHNAAAFRALLPQEVLLRETSGGYHVYHQFTIRVGDDQRKALREHMLAASVQTDVYYPTPLHMQSAFQTSDSLPASEALARSVLSIPVHPSLSRTDVEYIAASVSDFLGSSSARRVH